MGYTLARPRTPSVPKSLELELALELDFTLKLEDTAAILPEYL